jgi:2-iminobutanoate/2-iminopropanoate deaminase
MAHECDVEVVITTCQASGTIFHQPRSIKPSSSAGFKGAIHMRKEVVSTDKAARTGAPLSQAVKLGNLVFCSGASPRDPKQGNKVVEGGFREQATQALENLKAVLEASGTGFAHCLKATCYLMNVDENLPILNELWVRYFGQDLPARTAVGVAKLRENYMLEVEVIAYVPPE